MSDVEGLITALGNEGASAATITDELNRRGFCDRRKMPFTRETVESYLRMLGIGPSLPFPALELSTPEPSSPTEAPPAVFHDPLKKLQAEAYQAGEDLPPAEPLSINSKEGAPLGEPRYHPGVLGQWPTGINYGGDNCYPDAPPYNYTHPGRYCGSDLRGGSSASQALMGGH
ncbi:MAG TPA: hypothetical protein VHW09_26965 [Bryobacteraceae bacterium]|jgi:hypothetical protein|nr:hypothetical protein [Bryobacteraceae bacterium]